jgi:putative spermidine/putrescine transport system permease protein
MISRNVAAAAALRRRDGATRRRVGIMPHRADSIWSVLLCLSLIAGCIFLLAPILIILMIALSSAQSIAFPPPGFTLLNFARIPHEIMDACARSMVLGASVVLADMVICLPAAFALVRGRVPGRGLIEALFRSPLQIPGIVMAVAFYLYYSQLQRIAGISLRNDFVGLVIAHVVMTSPFMLAALTARLYNVKRSLEEASYGLGAGFFMTFWHVTMPQVRPALLAGSFIAFVISFEDVPVALFLAPATSQMTLPVVLFNNATDSLSPQLFAAAILVLLFSVVLVIAVELLIGLRKVISSF